MEVIVTILPAARKRLGLAIINGIEANIDQAVDRHGKPFEPYSTRPFARPLAGLPKRVIQVLKDAEGLQVFTTKGGDKWAVILHGYEALKAAWRPGSESVDLTLTGDMLRQMAVIRDTDQEIIIGFLTDEAAQKAFYHTVAGAGKRRVIRDFLGMPDAQWEKVGKAAIGEKGIQIQVRV